MKVSATNLALELIEDLKKTHGAELLFHQSGGCCDGSAPMCYPVKEFLISDDDVLVGKIGGIPFYISETQHTTRLRARIQLVALLGWQPFLGESLKET